MDSTLADDLARLAGELDEQERERENEVQAVDPKPVKARGGKAPTLEEIVGQIHKMEVILYGKKQKSKTKYMREVKLEGCRKRLAELQKIGLESQNGIPVQPIQENDPGDNDNLPPKRSGMAKIVRKPKRPVYDPEVQPDPDGETDQPDSDSEAGLDEDSYYEPEPYKQSNQHLVKGMFHLHIMAERILEAISVQLEHKTGTNLVGIVDDSYAQQEELEALLAEIANDYGDVVAPYLEPSTRYMLLVGHQCGSRAMSNRGKKVVVSQDGGGSQ